MLRFGPIWRLAGNPSKSVQTSTFLSNFCIFNALWYIFIFIFSTNPQYKISIGLWNVHFWCFPGSIKSRRLITIPSKMVEWPQNSTWIGRLGGWLGPGAGFWGHSTILLGIVINLLDLILPGKHRKWTFHNPIEILYWGFVEKIKIKIYQSPLKKQKFDENVEM